LLTAQTTRSQKYLNDVVKAFVKGAAVGGAVFAPATYFASKRYAGYRALPLPGKVFLGMMFIVPVGTVFAEKAGEHYISTNQWDSVGKNELQREAAIRDAKWNSMTTTEKIKDWSAHNQYTIIGGSWVASLGIAFGLVARNKYQTFPQKLVQARMYAQFLTVGVLLGSAVLAGVNAQGKKPEAHDSDHSWKDILEQGGTLTHAERIQLVAAPATPAAESS
jgi:hypothetical protein